VVSEFVTKQFHTFKTPILLHFSCLSEAITTHLLYKYLVSTPINLKYRIVLIFGGSKFSRIAVLENLIEIIS